MALTQKQIEEFAQKARQAGFSESQIAQEVARKSQGLGASPQEAQDRGLIRKVGDMAVGMTKPFTRTLANIGTAIITPQQAALASGVSNFNPELGAKIASKDILGTQSKAKDIIENPRKSLMQQARDSAAVGSYAVPMGTGTNIFSKAVTPGAISGGMQGFSQEDATTGDIVGSALLGGVSAGILESIFTAPKWLGKAGKKTQKVSSSARTGKVYLKSSLTGAADEKAVEKTLQKYGIKGTPQKRYELLEPTTKRVTSKIDNLLAENPQKVGLKEIRDVFKSKVSKAIRQGDVTQKEAMKAFDDYFKEVAKTSPDLFQNNIATTPGLFELKKDMQAGMSSLYKKVGNDTSLTSTQKVLKSMRDSLDDVIKTKNPKVKKLTMDQSRLYDAARSLGQQRKTVPTVRGPLGFTVPQGVVQQTKDATLRATESGGKKLSGMSKVTPAPDGVGAFLGSRVPSIGILNEGKDDVQNANNQANNQNGQQNATNNLYHGGSIPQGLGNTPQELGQSNPFNGASKSEVLTEALQAGLNMSDISRLSALYDELVPEGAAVKKTEKQQLFVNAASAAQEALGLLNSGQVKTGVGQGIMGGIGEKIGTNSKAQQQYRSSLALARTAARNAMLGANMTEKEMESLSAFIPEYGDAPSIAKTKLETFVRMMNEFGQNMQGTGLGATPQDISLGEI